MQTRTSPRQFSAFVLMTACVTVMLLSGNGYGQASGARGGFERVPSMAPPLSPEQADRYITVEATVERRVKPTEVRIVLALVEDAKTAAECRKAIADREQKLRAAIQPLKLEENAITTDFISILPKYEWVIETQNEERLAVEKRAGFRMQSNVHIKVPSDAEASQVLDAAFSVGVTDIIAFDYWSSELDTIKTAVQKEALIVAEGKSKRLLAPISNRPFLINVQEQTRVIFPRSKYASFENTQAARLQQAYSRREPLPRVAAPKPQNVYYRGFQEQTDVQGGGLPMKPMISVVSTIRLYYR